MRRNHLNRLFGTRRSRFQGPDAFPLHDHSFGEIFWIEAGRCGHEVNGKSFLLGPGDCVFIRPWDAHRFFSPVGRTPFWLINTAFQWHVLEGLKQRHYGNQGGFYGEEDVLPKTIRLRSRQLEAARAQCIGLINSPQSAFYIERFLMNLFAEIAPPEQVSIFTHGRPPSWLRQAWQAIQHPAHLRLGVPEFQRLCGRSAEHVSREFRRHAGRTVTAVVNELRMRRAAALLAGTEEDILEIAAQCGFESLSHFYLRFRETHGAAPGAYRRKMQTGLDMDA